MKNNYHLVVIATIVIFFLFSCHNTQNHSEPEMKPLQETLTPSSTAGPTDELVIKDEKLDKNATVLAGLDTSNISDTNTLKVVRKLNRIWTYKTQKIIQPIQQWMKDEHINDSIASEKLMFYPFSGPDFEFANTFYPDADEYILCGLERSGNDSSLIFSDKLQPDSFLISADQYFFYSNRFGFFRTLDMEKQFEKRGVIDIIAFYLKRAGATIGMVNNFHWSPTTGELTVPDTARKANVCYFKFQLPSGKSSSLYYFRKDLSDAGLGKDSLWLQWVKKEAGNKQIVSLTKSASYLMHTTYFSIVRNFILNHSSLHIQDDSGIDFAHLKNSGRKTTLYGSYSNVISLFKNKFQPDLKEMYHSDSSHIKSLPFRIGYNLKIGETNLQVTYR